MGKAVLTAENDCRAFVERELLERVHQIMFQSGINGLRVVFCFQSSFIDPDQLFALAGIFAKAVVSDAVEPGGKFRLTTKAGEISIGTNKCFLGQVVGQPEVVARKLAQETSDGRLVISHQLRKSVLIIFNQDTSDKFGVIKRHAFSLHLGGRRILAADVQAPDQEVSEADKERDNPEAPGATFPVVDRAKEDH